MTALGDWVQYGGRYIGLTVVSLFWILGLAGLFWPLAFWTAGHVFAVGGGSVLVLSVLGASRGIGDTWWELQPGHNGHFFFPRGVSLWSSFRAFLGHLVLAQLLSQGNGGGWTWTSVTKQRVAGCHSCCHKPRTVAWWFLALMIFVGFRVGEASHPGPTEGQMDVWTLGIANPSGLNGKLDQVCHLDGHTWLLSETQLSQKGVSTFTKGLRMLQSKWKYAVPGSPCTPRLSTDTGTHSGVMCLSVFPARALTHDFAPEVYETARLQVYGLAVADTWVTLGILYGLPCNARHKNARFQTDALLSELVDRVACQAAGPRAIGGDFNFGPDELGQLDRLRAMGFREVQDLRAWRFGLSAEPTGRGTRRIDQLWISPELQRAYLSTDVDFSCWADHAAVSATFSHQGLTVSVSAWPCPQSLPWPKGWDCPLSLDFGGDLTVEYAKFWMQLEGHARIWNRHHGIQVTKTQCGRASVLEPKRTKRYLCPIKKAKTGDAQPSFIGVSLQHARYGKQLRRLQSLVRLLSKGTQTWNACLNRDETWSAIRHASGFPGGFGPWWILQGLQPGLFQELPLICPSVDFVAALFQGFQGFVKQYEATLVSQRYRHAKHRREQKLAYVFQDCKDDPLPQADTLIDRVQVGIEEVRPEDNSLVLVQPVRLIDDLPVVVEGQVVQVVAHSEDQVWLDSLPVHTPGGCLSQERAVLTDEAILDRFAAVWRQRWTKQSHVQPGQWDQICGFLEHTVRPISWTFAPWTCERLQQAIRHKKARAARGPDGVSQTNLASLPPTAVQHLVGFYQAVEQGARWPSQLASGFVTSLAKHAHAQQVEEFRPVVVYSLPYRVWSSERAREALRSVGSLLPDSVQGGVPSRQAKTIWFELAYALERAHLTGAPLHGLLMDIQKCFNNIPRQPLWFALALMDFPHDVLRAWVSFVAGQSRRFKVRQSVGAPLMSNCGLPEGCALSVFGMAVVDWMLDWWLRGLDVSVDLRTFVDDWGVLFRDQGAFHRIWTAMEDFTSHLDLAIDMAKTRLWSTDADARKAFRQSPVTVTLGARNLGAHQNFSKHCHNAELQKRLKPMPQVWIRLRASHSPYRSKVTALHMMAWPRALHGISVVHLGSQHFKVLRSGAAKALRADRKGANPYLHLATSSLLSDPEAWSVVQTLREVRELGCPEQVESALGLYSNSPECLPNNGPTAILLTRLQRLGWAVGGQGLIQDRLGTFSLMSIAWDELVLRVKLAWGHVLAGELSHRPTFSGLERVDLTELHVALSQFGAADQVFLRCHLDGTLFTQHGRAKFRADVTSSCPWCTAKDGFHHRAWICPFFAPCRSHLTADQLRVLPLLPACLVDHVWPVVLPEWELLTHWLLQDDGLCKMSPVEPSVRSMPHVLDLFVDGTSAFPQEAKLRFAAWAVTAVPGGTGTYDNQVLMAGHVRGLCQSPYRAELSAVLHAVVWAVQHGRAVRIWCDCQGVVKGVSRMLHKRPIRKNAPHSDLWMQLRQTMQGHEQLVTIHKVVSHGVLAKATSPLEHWVYWHNHLADVAAESANLRRPPEFWVVWKGMQQALHFYRKLHADILLVLLQTSRMAVQGQSNSVVQPSVAPSPDLVLKVPETWTIPDRLFKRYGQHNLQQVHQWWLQWGPAMMQQGQPLKYIAGIQLFVSFNLFTGYDGPWCHQKRWYSEEGAAPEVARKSWGSRCKLFLLLFKSYMKGNKVVLPNRMTRPHSSAVAMWLVSYRLAWTDAMVEKVDRAIFTQLKKQACSNTDLAALQAARIG